MQGEREKAIQARPRLYLLNFLSTKSNQKTITSRINATKLTYEYLSEVRSDRINDLLFEEPDGHDFIQPFMSTTRANSSFDSSELRR